MRRPVSAAAADGRTHCGTLRTIQITLLSCIIQVLSFTVQRDLGCRFGESRGAPLNGSYACARFALIVRLQPGGYFDFTTRISIWGYGVHIWNVRQVDVLSPLGANRPQFSKPHLRGDDCRLLATPFSLRGYIVVKGGDDGESSTQCRSFLTSVFGAVSPEVTMRSIYLYKEGSRPFSLLRPFHVPVKLRSVNRGRFLPIRPSSSLLTRVRPASIVRQPHE